MTLIFLINFLFAIATTIGMAFIPLLVTENLGMSLFVLGFIEGTAELSATILRLITGNIFDRAKDRRLLFIIPTALALGSKLILYIPTGITIITSKIIERISNGAFAAPRDAYIGEKSKNKGIALGFLSASKTFGCILGPIIVSISTIWFGPLEENIQTMIFLACFINVTAFAISFFINTKKKISLTADSIFNLTELKESCGNLRLIFILSLVFFLGRFNDGLIMLCLKHNGFQEWFYLATISFFNIVMFIISPFMGYMIDKKKEYQILFLTITSLIWFNIFFLNLTYLGWTCACLGIICWGIQRVGAQITFSAMIFKRTPIKFYGTAIGIYSLLTGLGFFASSLISGYLAQTSFANVFILSGCLSMMALALAFYIYLNDTTAV